MIDKLIEYFETFVNANRKATINKTLEYRTRYLTVVLEDIFQTHNVSAVIRTCECFGIQDVHIIENRNRYQLNPKVALGAEQWLTIVRHRGKNNNTAEALNKLKAQGYRIVAATPHNENIDLDNFNFQKGKIALVFGTELQGISDLVYNMADEYIKIPMYGFTESFNISVSVALIVHHLISKLHKSQIKWQIAGKEKKRLKLEWLKNSVKKPDLIEKYFLENIYKKNKRKIK
jgi:tRNA (guanosine-2'-O-)-methyltransferase